jgi:cytoskeletal protein RodZ
MVESVGSRLQRARLAKKLDVEEVAERTKIRPDRLIDLEADEYSYFPNLTYAKSFLAKYAKFLGVDIQEDLETFQISRSISMGDYQYLSSISASYHATQAPWPQRIQPRGFRVPPAVVVVLVLIVLVGVPVFSYLALNFPRVAATGNAALIGKRDQTTDGSVEAANAATPVANSLRSLAAPSASGGETSTETQASSDRDEAKAETTPVERSGHAEDGIEVRKALPPDASQPVGPSDATIQTSLSTLPDKKLEVRVIRRTYVKVTKDKEGTQPVFEGYAGPDSRPIIVEGKRFWVHVVDKAAVEVREDGQLVSGGSNDIVIN